MKDKISIIATYLTNKEIEKIIFEVKKFPLLVAGDKKRWIPFQYAYVARIGKSIIGLCSIVKLNKWIKLGPFVVFKQYQGKGISKQILNKILEDNLGMNMYIASATPQIWKIAERNGFEKCNNFFLLPFDIQKYLIRQTFSNMNIPFITEFINKNPFKRKEFRFYLKYANE